MSTCSICCENYNKSTRKCIICPNEECQLQACKQCVRYYIKNSSKDPHCMQCKNGWDYTFLIENLNRSFVMNEYKHCRRQVLCDREIPRLPEYMAIAETFIEYYKLVDLVNERDRLHYELYTEWCQKYHDIQQMKFNKSPENDITNATGEREILCTRMNKLKKLNDGSMDTLWRMRARLFSNKKRKRSTKKFIMPCTFENCNGYLSKDYKCDICQNFTCPDCLKQIGPYEKEHSDHECCKEDLESAEFIRQDTKACPKCGTRIHKLEGCPQMWCTNCQTAFNWETGQIDTGTIHNPHFLQFRREGKLHDNTQNALHECNADEIPNAQNFHRNVTNLINVVEVVFELTQVYDFVYHIHYSEIPNYQELIENVNERYMHYVEYILNRISKENFAKKLQLNDIEKFRLTQKLQIFEIIDAIGKEIIIGLYNLNFDHYSCLECLDIIYTEIFKFHEIIDYCNEQFCKLSNTFRIQCPNIAKNNNGHWKVRKHSYYSKKRKQITENNNSETSKSLIDNIAEIVLV